MGNVFSEARRRLGTGAVPDMLLVPQRSAIVCTHPTVIVRRTTGYARKKRKVKDDERICDQCVALVVALSCGKTVSVSLQLFFFVAIYHKLTV